MTDEFRLLTGQGVAVKIRAVPHVPQRVRGTKSISESQARARAGMPRPQLQWSLHVATADDCPVLPQVVEKWGQS
ncbi:hypothetical protein [Pseudomonas sp. RIT-To-2]|uniref:hypothetical protein n=1 Tax=Pseudomonas sp. RIT-To-2 TaxID=3462541 RepID=UPI002413049B